MHSAIRALFIVLAILVLPFGPANAEVSIPALESPAAFSGSGQDLFTTPTITSVQGRVVQVEVPPGYEQVTIERRVARRTQPWRVFASQSCSLEGGTVTLKLPRPMPKAFLRVIGRK